MNGVALAGKRMIAQVLGNEVLGRALGRALKQRVPSRGLVIDTSSEWVSGHVKAALAFNMYESAESRFVQRYLRSDLDTIEFGASLGFVSCQIRRRLERNARLFCVEANPNLLPVLRRNLELNVPGAEVTTINAAVDESGAEFIELALGRDNLDSRVNASADRRITVKAIQLREFVREHAIEQYALVCDIEGSEAGFIFGDPAALQGCRQILIELHNTAWNGRDLSVGNLRDALVDRHGFRQVDTYGRVFVFER
jgi:FkbM family methyltransferase